MTTDSSLSSLFHGYIDGYMNMKYYLKLFYFILIYWLTDLINASTKIFTSTKENYKIKWYYFDLYCILSYFFYGQLA